MSDLRFSSTASTALDTKSVSLLIYGPTDYYQRLRRLISLKYVSWISSRMLDRKPTYARLGHEFRTAMQVNNGGNAYIYVSGVTN